MGADSTASYSAVREAGEEQAACQFCKYLLEGARLGDCRVIRWIGSGAFGDVYEAEQVQPLNRRVAIKVMSLERVVDGEFAEMFAREISTIAALDHPNILPVLRAGMIDDGRSYLVMKFAAQGSLQQFCQVAAPALSFMPTAVAAPSKIVETPADILAMVAETPNDAQATEKKATCIPEARTGEEEKSEQGDQDRHEAKGEKEAQEGEAEQLETAPAEINVELIEEEPKTQEQAGEALLETETPTSTQVSSLISVVEATKEVQIGENAGAIEATEKKPARAAIATAKGRAEELEELVEQIPGEVRAEEQEELVEQAPGEVRAEELEELVEQTSGEVSEEELVEQAPGEARPESQDGVANAPEAELVSTVILANGTPPAVVVPSLFPQCTEALILSPQQVLHYLDEAAAALHYAHQRGLIHLDVKPANLLLDAQGRLMLADFGVSVLLEGYTHASLHYYVGTPLYTAPEQWLEQPRPASDQYALAVTCYQLLAGRAPFTGNLYSVMHGHLQASPPPMGEFNPLIPAQIEEVIRRALAKIRRTAIPMCLPSPRLIAKPWKTPPVLTRIRGCSSASHVSLSNA